jgi:pyruvate ferredoxin oxidoreductase alpha subunit
MGGILHTELAAALYGQPGAPLLASFVAGLGGRDVAPEEFFEIAAVARRAAERGVAPEPQLLYTAGELRAVRALQAIALAERMETSR